MSRISKQPRAAGLGRGTTRTLDIMLDDSVATIGSGAFPGLRARGSGATFGGGNITNNGAVWGYVAGRLAINVNSGLGYGLSLGYGLKVLTVRPAHSGAFTLRAGVSRLMASMIPNSAVDSFPSADQGLAVTIGSGGISDFRSQGNVHGPGCSGWGLYRAQDGFTWRFVTKLMDTGANSWGETTPVAFPADVSPSEVEFRVIDATDAVEASLELWLNGAKQLTRYWTNPPGISTPTLPPLAANSAGLLYLQLRNTVNGPAVQSFFDPALIQGPNDAGTL